MELQISVLIITYNRKKELERAVLSAARNKNDKIEIVIVDNNSTDGTEELVREMQKTVDIPIEYFKMEVNLGVAGGRNEGFKRCRGKYLFSLDDDAEIISDNFFGELYKYMEEHKDTIAASVRCFEPSTNRIIKGETIPPNPQIACEELTYIGGAHILRRSFWEKEGQLYPKQLKYGSEELYASLIIWDRGKKIEYIPTLTVHHLPSKINRQSTSSRDINILINALLIRKLTYPPALLPLLYILFYIRLYKNKLATGNIRMIRKTIKERYDPKEKNRIKLFTIIKLAKKYGINNLI